MKTTTSKFTVAELAKMMGKPAKEVLFLLQGIGVDVKTAESVLDPATAQALLLGKTQAPKSLIVRQAPSAAAAAAAASASAAKAKIERAALKRIKIVERSPDEEVEAGEAPAADGEATAAIVTAVTAVTASAPDEPAPARVEAAAHAPETPAEAMAPELPAPVAVQPPAPVPAPAPKAAPAAAATPATPAPRPPARIARPVDAPIQAVRRPASPSPRIAPPPAPAGPAGALGRILKRTGDIPPRPSAAPVPPPPAPRPDSMMSYGASAGPHSPGVTHVRTAPAASQAGASAGASAPPMRGAGGLGRAVIAAPPAPVARPVRPAQPMPPSGGGFARPGFSPRPPMPMGGMPPRPGFAPRPGFSPRPGGPSGPGFGPRPPFGRPPLGGAPAAPLPDTAERRKKDATKPGLGVKKGDAKKTESKKPRTKEVSALEEDVREYLGSYKQDTYEDIQTPSGEGTDEALAAKPLSKSAQRRAGKKTTTTETGEVVELKKKSDGPVFLSEGVTVKELSEKLGILAKDLMKSFLSRGVFATINQPLDPKIAVEIAKEFGVEAAVVSFEEELELSRQQTANDQAAAGTAPAEDAGSLANAGERIPRAPVVTVMGHVDHGKTSLLDAIRKENVAEGEAGGITQHIGAYRVIAKGKPIVFLDTPGHEAFTMMRSRGAKATDIVVLVVAADDGVMPQTQEAIDHARAAKVPLVVAINKIDKPDANTQRVKQELAEKGVLVEEFGGDVVACEISAKKKIGIDQLLEMILLQADLLELKSVATGPARGVVLEARREAGKGTLATVLIQQGTLHVGDVFFAGTAVGRVRAMLDDHSKRVTEAPPATPVEVMGFEDIPNAGDTLQVVENEGKARQVSQFRSLKEREESLTKSSRMSLDSLFNRMKEGEMKDLALIVKADVHGSEEVLLQSLAKLSTEKVKVSVLHSGVGAISVNDVLLASASEAIIIGFNVKPEKKAQELADHEGVDIRLYSVIYTLTDEIKKAMTGLLDTVKKEVTRGHAEVRETFKVPKIGTISGCMVTDGVIPRTASVRLIRDSRVIYEGKIGSLRRFKDDASEVKQGFECGIGIAGYQDVKIGDVLEAFIIEELAGSLT
ncbi:MAG: translation initiation factor IF-2 [Acidobacteriota bacterium]|nr:translation initiation factor IF-2 [Acidobacteriota bacterium]